MGGVLPLNEYIDVLSETQYQTAQILIIEAQERRAYGDNLFSAIGSGGTITIP